MIQPYFEHIQRFGFGGLNGTTSASAIVAILIVDSTSEYAFNSFYLHTLAQILQKMSFLKMSFVPNGSSLDFHFFSTITL